jgi:hypothetical protein
MQMGPSLHPASLGVWRLVSEDSDQVRSGLAAVHLLCDLGDLDHSDGIQMPARVDQPYASREALEVVLLRGLKRMLLEEGNDLLEQIRALPHDESVHVLTMIVVPPIDGDLPSSEEPVQILQGSLALGALNDYELVSDLVTGGVALSARTASLADEADGEATFSVYETGDPTNSDQPFLLIVRTVRLVTAHLTKIGRVPDGYTGFPAYGQMLSVTLLPHRATNSLP